MNCDQARECFSAYIEGELEGASLVAFKHHLDTCQGCLTESRELARILPSFGKLDAMELPYGLHERIMDRFTDLHEAKNSVVRRVPFWDALVGRGGAMQRWARTAAVAGLLALLAISPYVPGVNAVWTGLLPGFQRNIPAPQDSIAIRVSRPIEGAISTLSIQIAPERDVENAWVRARLTNGTKRSSEGGQVFNWRVNLRHGEYTSMSVPLEFTSAGVRTLRVQITGNEGEYRAEKMAFLPVRAKDQARQSFGTTGIYLDARDMDIYEVLAVLSSTTKTPIIMDTDLHGKVSVNLEGEQLGGALAKVLSPLGYTWNPSAGVYIIRTEPTQ